jgi:hypothetical protein
MSEPKIFVGKGAIRGKPPLESLGGIRPTQPWRAADIALVEHGVDGLVQGSGVSDMHVLVLAVGGAFSLESPDWLVLVLGNGCVLSIYHGIDGGVARFSEVSEHVSVSMCVEDRDRATLLARRRGVTRAGA